MAEKEIKIRVSTEADTQQVQDLQEMIERLQNGEGIHIETDVDVNSIEAMESELEVAKQTVEDLENQLTGIEMGEIDGDFEEVSTQLEEAAARVDELQSSLDNLNTNSTSDISGGFDEVGSSADNATTEIDELQGSMDLLNAGALMGISSELGALGDKAEGMAQDMNNAAITVGQLATQTGIAEPQLVDMISHISNATFPQEEAMMYVKSLDQIGVSSNNLGKSATDLDKINDAFGLGAGTVNSLGQELSVLGVDMNNVSSSFNALSYANANTVGGMENYYAFLRKYDAQFNELGFNVDQASVIIAGATQKFGGGRAALTGLSDALKNANGDTRALEEALGLQAGSIENASQLTSEYEGQLQTMANEEMEHKTWLDQLGAAWEDLSLKMSGVMSPLASVMGVIGQVGSLAVGINGINTLVASFRKLETVQKIGGRLSGLKSTITGVGSAARATGGRVLTLAKNLGSTVLSAAKNAGLAFLNLGKQVLTAGLNALKTVGMWIAQKAQLLASSVASGIATIKNWLLAASEWAVASPILIVIGIIVALIAVLGYLYFNNEQVRNAVNGLGQAFQYAGQIIYNTFITILNWVTNALQALWNYIFTVGGLIPANVSITGNQIIDTILRVMLFVFTLPLQLAMVFTNIIAKVLGFGDNFAQRMIQGAVNMVNGFINKIRELPGMIQGEFARIEGIVSNFITSLPQRVWDLGASIVQALKNALGIGSPGHMFYMFEGELNRLKALPDSMKSDITHNVAGLGSGMVDSFNSVNGLDFNTNDVNFSNNRSNSNGDGSGQTFNLYFYDTVMDNEERVDNLVDRITKRLYWNNKTAGRIV